jgi:hypothetical protein
LTWWKNATVLKKNQVSVMIAESMRENFYGTSTQLWEELAEMQLVTRWTEGDIG